MYEARKREHPKEPKQKAFTCKMLNQHNQLKADKMKIKMQPTICTFAWLATSGRFPVSIALAKCHAWI